MPRPKNVYVVHDVGNSPGRVYALMSDFEEAVILSEIIESEDPTAVQVDEMPVHRTARAAIRARKEA